MKTLILGAGEIGNSLLEILSKEYEVDIYDQTYSATEYTRLFGEDFEIMHVCFPYSEHFLDFVKEYQEYFKPKYTIIHSTVPVGTCRDLGAIHSPVIGIHPHLQKSLTTFTKFLGGTEASKVANYFRSVGMKVYLTDKSETTELCKIQSTNFYSLCIEFFKDMKNQCKNRDVPFEFWTIWNDNYNQGYKKLGYPEYSRPNLVPIMTKQGGHCTLPNLELLDSNFTNLLKEITIPKSL